MDCDLCNEEIDEGGRIGKGTVEIEENGEVVNSVQSAYCWPCIEWAHYELIESAEELLPTHPAAGD